MDNATAIAAILEAHSTPDPATGCLTWQRSKNPGGYGQMTIARKVHRVHRVAWELAHGALPPTGLLIDHKCRNRLCVNVGHMHLVTRKQNGENIVARRGTVSGVRGVYRCKSTGRWAVEVTHNQKKHWVGRFDTLEDAERAAIAKRNELFTNNLADRSEP
jgi:hypothetical protein